jgi:hypothetical protein
MSFDKEPLKILPNGLNLAPPGDQVAAGDCLELTGWFPGSVGKLEQARGWVQKNTQDVGVTLNSISECDGRVYYSDGGFLWQIGRDAAGVHIDDAYDGYPLGMCPFQGKMWLMNRNHQRKDDGGPSIHSGYVGPSNWGVEVPGSPGFTAGGSGGLVDGAHVYFVTFTDIYGYESNPCPEVDVTLSSGGSNNGSVTFMRPAASASTLIQGWNLYHQSPAAAGPYLVNPSVIPYATTSYTDFGDAAHNQDDATLIANDVLLEADHDPPPPARVMAAVPYNGRIVVANSAAHTTRIWYTEADQPSFFPGSDSEETGNWVDIQAASGAGGEEILYLSVRPGYLMVYLNNSIWRITGDFADSSSVISPLIQNMGIAGPRAVVATSQGDLAMVRQGVNFGIYRVTDWEQRIGGKVDPIFRGLETECYHAINLSAVTSTPGAVAVGYGLGRLWISYSDGGHGLPSQTLILEAAQDDASFGGNGRWFSRALGISCFYHGSACFYAAIGGLIVSLEDGAGPEGIAGHVPVAYQSAYLDSGDPDNEKTYGDLVLNHNTGGATLNVDIRRNKNADAFTLATINSSSMTRQVIPMVYPATYPTVALRGQAIEAFNVSIRIYGNGPLAYPGVAIDGPIILHHFLKPTRAMTWDSGPTDLGMQGVKEIDRIEIDIDAPSALNIYLWTDLTGSGALSLAQAISLTGTNGRAILPVIGVGLPFQGRIWRFQLQAGPASPKPFLLYRFRVRAVPIGVWVDGAVGDSWYVRANGGVGLENGI